MHDAILHKAASGADLPKCQIPFAVPVTRSSLNFAAKRGWFLAFWAAVFISYIKDWAVVFISYIKDWAVVFISYIKDWAI